MIELELNVRQKRFVDKYVETGNAAEAARHAGYSEKTARSQGQRLLTHVDICQYIKKHRQIEANESIISLERCLEKLTEIINDEKSTKKEVMQAMDMRLKTLGAYTSNVNANVQTISINVDIDD